MGRTKGKISIDTKDILGMKVGKLEVVGYVGFDYWLTNGGPRMRHWYLVKCDCGAIKRVQRGALKNGITNSCGCSKKQETYDRLQ